MLVGRNNRGTTILYILDNALAHRNFLKKQLEKWASTVSFLYLLNALPICLQLGLKSVAAIALMLQHYPEVVNLSIVAMEAWQNG